jgi:alpha-amylase/alpha-mannosidase (GH57 family)
MHWLVIHQHLYQPPREDPWLELVPREASAAPDHDWNARITRECYARQAAAERWLQHGAPHGPSTVNDPDARAGLAQVVNLYAWCSFDVGPTLCEWLEREAPDTMRAMQQGDAASVQRWGHGNAIAAPYHHVILPLASPRERRTEIRWGLRDFQRRFGRAAEGFWLPECAVDEATLESLADEGLRFVILAPYQVEGHDGRGLPLRWEGSGGRTLTILPYDGSLAGDVAFGGLLRNAEALAQRFTPFRDWPREQLEREPRATTLCTDGETFGHHHAGGEATLLDALRRVAERNRITTGPHTELVNAATLVDRVPATMAVRLVSPSAWSCAHGVERWRGNCGCRLDGHRPPQQGWRGPLRDALSALAERAHTQYAHEARSLFANDPWQVRDAYGEVVSEDGEALEAFVRTQLRTPHDAAHSQRARELLELERATLRLFTSCAWFFDDVDRIEVRQVLRYAARVLELSGQTDAWVGPFLDALRLAKHEGHHGPSAADVFLHDALPDRDVGMRVAAGTAAMASTQVAERTSPIPSRLGVYDLVVTPEVASGNTESRHWHIALHHRRSGVRTRYHATVRGRGAAMKVWIVERSNILHQQSHAQTRAEQFSVHELPELAARAVLNASRNDDTLTALQHP